MYRYRAPSNKVIVSEKALEVGMLINYAQWDYLPKFGRVTMVDYEKMTINFVPVEMGHFTPVRYHNRERGD